MRILIADEDRAFRRDLERHLAGWGHEVVPTADGQEALLLLQSDVKISAVLSNRYLPRIDALEMCRRVRELKRPRYLPILLFSPQREEKHLAEGLEAGADGFLSKPVNTMELQAHLRLLERLLFLEERLGLELRNLEEAYARVEELAQTDDLTRVANRRSILDRLEREIARARRYDSTVSVLLLDIDRFKEFNDTHGHAAGDMVLRKLAELLVQTLRTSDGVGRYGGEEFLVVLPSVGAEEAAQTGERLRREIQSTPFPIGGPDVHALTISIGVAELDRELDLPGSLLTRADRALYQAKNEGNRVCADLV